MRSCWSAALGLLVGVVIGINLLDSTRRDRQVVHTAPTLAVQQADDNQRARAPQSAYPGPAYTSAAPRTCSILVDRHLHKNGGTTLRDILLENEKRGEWFYWGYSLGRLTPIFDELRRLAVSGNTTHRIAIEYHQGFIPFTPNVLEQIRQLRATYRMAGIDCRIVLGTRVRDPLSFYISYYKWAGRWRQREDPEKYGRNFMEWAPPNLQSALMLNSMNHMWVENVGINDRRRIKAFNNFSAGDMRRLQDMLLHFDIVGMTERFDEALLLLADMTGLQHLEYHVNDPTRNSKWKRGVKIEEICPDLEACRQHIARIAPFDVQIYDESVKRFDALVHGAGESFQRRLALFRAEQRNFSSMKQKMLRCRYWPVRPDRYNRSHHDCKHLAQKDLCALVFANRELRCPWHRVAYS